MLVDTTAGRLRGRNEDGIATFKGIPYAAPPVGANRFRPPQPLASWAGVRDALEYGPSAPQPRERPPGWSFEQDESEDCLYLNVWTPATDTARRPVMFWIHGGGYSIGSGSWPLYDGAALARRGDVVVVTVNHRLGALGFLHLGELAGDEFSSSGNNGLLDLVQALQWVRDNIAAFGGDPDNVTAFGESGGGAKISVLLAMPAAHGLFHRAAIQSGPGLRVMREERATDAARRLLDTLTIDASDVERLWSVPAEVLGTHGRLGGAPATGSPSGGRLGFSPVLDGTVIPAQPGDALASGQAADVPVIVGCNRDEVFGRLPSDLDEAGLRDRLRQYGEEHVEEIVGVYREEFADASPADLASWIGTDAGMRAGSIRLAEQKLKGGAAPVFMYFFTYEMGGRAGHGYEIQFVFDNIRPPIAHTSPSRQWLADRMSEAWLAFARDGDPGHPAIPKWPAYTLPERATMVFGRDQCEVVNDPSPGTRELWQRLAESRSRR